jgi:hypothetical protein
MPLKRRKKKMITKKQYVDRLEEMLNVDKPCSTCPALVGFVSHRSDIIKVMDGWTVLNVYLDWHICDHLCKPFVGLTPIDSCPCHQLGEQEAIKRAHIAIDEYRSSQKTTNI